MTEKILSENYGISENVIISPLVQKLTKFHAKYVGSKDVFNCRMIVI